MSESSPRERWTVYFSGQVQGVGFRYTTERVAARFEVRGYVRNLPDGRVELVAEGAADELGRLADAIGQEMAGYIREKVVSRSPGTGEFPDFSIRH